MKVSVVIEVSSDTPGIPPWSRPLTEAETVFLSPILFGPTGIPTPPPPAGPPPKRTADWIDRAFTGLGQEMAKTRELAEWMLAHGWVTKSRRPVVLVGIYLGVSDRYERAGHKYWRRLPEATPDA